MSWSFEFYAEDKAHALRLLREQFAPEVTKAFVEAAIKGLREDSNANVAIFTDKIVHVKSNGHLADGPGSYEVSSCETRVQWIYVQGEPEETGE